MTEISVTENNAQKTPHLFYLPMLGGDDLWGAVDDGGQLVIPPIHRFLSSFQGELHGPVSFQGTNGYWGYMDVSGKEVHPATLDSARAFVADGFARVSKNGLWGFVKPDGSYLVTPQYEDVLYFSNGYAAVKKQGSWSYIKTDGEPLFDKKFAQAGYFSKSGLAAVRLKSGGKLGYINTQGEWVIQPQFDQGRGFFGTPNAPVTVDGKWGIIDTQGQWVVKPVYENINAFNDNGFAPFSLKYGKTGIIRQDGQVTLEPLESVFAPMGYYPLCNLLKINGYSASFFDLTGQPVKKMNEKKYLLTSSFDESCRALALSSFGGWYRVHADGSRTAFAEEVWEPYFDDRGDHSELALAHGRFIPVILRDRSLAYVDDTGQVALRARTQTNDSHDVLIISDASGKELWRHHHAKNTLLKTHEHGAFLRKGNFEYGFQTPTAEALSAKIAELKQRPAQPFTADAVDIKAYGGDDYGTGLRLAYASYHYFDHSGIYHSAIDKPDFSGQFQAVKKVLTELLGETLDAESVESEEQVFSYGWMHDSAVWLLDAGYLVLYDDYYEDGDVDYWAVLNLLLLPDQQTIRAKNGIPIIPIRALKTAEQSDPDVAAEVSKLKSKFSFDTGIEGRDQVMKTLSLAQSGKAISVHDYLWTQHALLKAAYDDNAELQLGTVEQAVALAEHLLAFIEQQGLGKDLLTTEGQFRLTVFRETANTAAWQIRETDPQRAYRIIEKALPYVRDQETYVYDTEVRILLNLGRQEEAFKRVQQVLQENPWYVDFQDFYENPVYRSWLTKQGIQPNKAEQIPSSNRSLIEKQNIAVHSATGQLAVYWNDELQLFDVHTGQRKWRRDAETYDPFTMKFNQDGDQLLTSGWDQLTIWDSATGQRLRTQKMAEGNSECAGFVTGEGHYYYELEFSLSNVFYVKEYSGKTKFRFNGVRNCGASDDGNFIAIYENSGWDEDDRISVVDLNEFKSAAQLVGKEANSYDDDMFFVRNNSHLLVRDFSKFHLWDINKQTVESSWLTGMDVDEVVVTNEFALAVDGDGWTINAWFFDQPPGKPLALNVPEYAKGDLNYRGLVLNSDKTQYILATANQEGNLFYIFVFDFKTHQRLKEYITPLRFGEMVLANDDTYLVLNSYPIQVLNLKTGQMVHEIKNQQ